MGLERIGHGNRLIRLEVHDAGGDEQGEIDPVRLVARRGAEEDGVCDSEPCGRVR